MDMKENLDNALYQSNNVPSAVDKAAVSLNENIGKVASCDGIMDKNQNATSIEILNNSSKQELVSLAINSSSGNLSFINTTSVESKDCLASIEVCKNGQDKNDKRINGFATESEMNTMNNGKLKRNDDQLNEIDSNESDEKIIKKICNNSTKSTGTNSNNKQNGNPGSSNSSINISTASSTLKEENCDNPSLSDNTETELNSEQFESEDDDLTEDENSWDCSVCTFRNNPISFKCGMCDVRKEMSTRKPRVNPKLLAQQVAKQQEQIQKEAIKAKEKCTTPKEKSKNNSENKRKTQDLEPMSPTSSTCSSKSIKREKKDKTPVKEKNELIDKNPTKNNFIFRLKDVDRTSGVTNSITVNNLTVVITEFQLKKSSDEVDNSNNKAKNGKKSSNKNSLR